MAEVPLGDLSEEQYRQLRSLPAAELERRLDMVRRYFIAMVGLRFDGQPVVPEVSFPAREGRGGPSEPTLPGHLVRLEGPVPGGAARFTFSAAPIFNLISLRIHRPGHPPVAEVFDPLRESTPVALADTAMEATRSSEPWAVVGQYGRLGFVHILPRGLDHILFVLGLFLLSPSLNALVWQVTAFTISHTATLALSMFGVIRLSPSVVEPLIALSIAYVAVENVLTARLGPWRMVVVFTFGLLHGLGFAGVLGGVGLPPGGFVAALVGFNLGVELGQFAVLGIAFGTVGWWRARPWYRPCVTVPASTFIALVGAYWAIARLASGP